MAYQKTMHFKQAPAARRASKRGGKMSFAQKFEVRENVKLRAQVASLQGSLTELANLIREDQELNAIADERSSGPFVRVSLEEL